MTEDRNQTLADALEVEDAVASARLAVGHSSNEPAAVRAHASVLTELRVLTVRFFRLYGRNPIFLAAELAQYIFMAVFIGLMYLQVKDDLDGVFDRLSSLFFLLAILSFVPLFSIVVSFAQELPLLMKECQGGYYRLASWYAARMIVSWPMEFVFTIVFSIPSYFMIGYQMNDEKFFVFLAGLFGFQLTSESIGFLIIVVCGNPEIAILLVSIVLIVFFAFGGFLVSKTPVYFIWVPWCSYFNYAYSALVSNEFEGLQIDCGDTASAVASGLLTNECQGVVEATSLIPSTIDNGISVTGNMFILYGLLVLTRTATFVVLWLRIVPWRARLMRLLRGRHDVGDGGAGAQSLQGNGSTIEIVTNNDGDSP